MQFVRFFLTGVVLVCVFLPPSALGQNSKSKDKAAKQKSAPMLRVTFNFEAIEGLPADSKLQVETLKIIEDGVAQKIDSLDSENQGVSYGLLIDTSGSMREYLAGSKLLGISLIDQLSSSDEMFVAQFKAEAELLQGMTTDKQDLYKSLQSLFTGANLVGVLKTTKKRIK